MSKNLFNIANPENCVCKVESYSPFPPILQIHVVNRVLDIKFYILFLGVVYYEGPVQWQGANFGLGNATDCLKLLKSMTGFRDIKEASLKEDYCLYEILSENTICADTKLRIIAAPNPSISPHIKQNRQ